jgi:hypothetical protein
MTKKFLVLMFSVALIAGFSIPAAAGDLAGPHPGYTYPGYVDAPDWTSNPYYTRKSWDLLPVPDPAVPGTYMGPALPLLPDAATYGGPEWVNPYGDPTLYATGTRVGYAGESLEHAWEFTDWGMGMECDDLYGHVGGMGSGYVLIENPNIANADLTKEIWLQYIMYLPKGGSGPADNTLTAFFLEAPELDPLTGDPISAGVGTRLSKEWEEFAGPGYSGNWWRVTELWEIDPQPGIEFLWLANNVEGGPATLIDSIDIQTKCVPIPASVLLLGSGLLGLIGFGRRKLKARG